MSYSSKRLSDIKNELERGVFAAVYNSPKQRWHRTVAGIMLAVKHALRGILFSWPLYCLALAAWVIPGHKAILFLVLLLPGLSVSWIILSRGVREDYSRLIDGYILRSGYLGRLLFYNRN